MTDYRPCGLCNWLAEMSDEGRFPCNNPDSSEYNKAVHCDDGTCELWELWEGAHYGALKRKEGESDD